MIMDIDLVINKINKETRSSIEENLKTFIVQVNNNNELIKMLNNVLKELPEYKNLQKKYDLLLKINKDLEEKIKYNQETKNITLNIEPVKNEVINNSVKKLENKDQEEETLEEEDEDEDEEEEDEALEEGEEERLKEEALEEGEEERLKETLKKEVEEVEEETTEDEGEDEALEETLKEEELKEEELEEEEQEETLEEEEEEDEEEEESEEEGEEEEELVEINIQNKKYFLNEMNNHIYECLDDDEPGDLIGKYINNKIYKK
jgi:hypothetical protein